VEKSAFFASTPEHYRETFVRWNFLPRSFGTNFVRPSQNSFEVSLNAIAYASCPIERSRDKKSQIAYVQNLLSSSIQMYWRGLRSVNN